MPISETHCMDCMDALRDMPDKAFDLAVVDPPYGYANSTQKDGRFGPSVMKQYIRKRGMDRVGNGWAHKYGRQMLQWDKAPTEEYFQQLFRVSKNQIIWGGNYFSLPPTRCFLVWDKRTISEAFTMAMCEYAWTSFQGNAKMFRFMPQNLDGKRFHPTQKPVELYRWIFGLYAKSGDRILDTHLGSGSSRIAAYDMGLDFVGYEISEEYFEMEEKRFQEYTAQTSMGIDLLAQQTNFLENRDSDGL